MQNGEVLHMNQTRKLTDEEKMIARKYLKALSRRGFGPRMPMKPDDPMGVLCGAYLQEIGWAKGDPIPKDLKPRNLYNLWGLL